MENNLNKKSLLDYCRRFSSKVTEEFYTGNSLINGEDILVLTSIKQINLFVIKNLFKEWQKETGKLESKYFNYQNDEVRHALKEFMNILSKNISIKKEDFTPILERSVEETILLIFSPYDYYTHMMDQNTGKVGVEELKRSSKYVKVNKNLLTLLIEKVDEEGLTSLDKGTFLQLLNYVFENIQESPEDIEDYLVKFSSIVPLREEDIYGTSESSLKEVELIEPSNLTNSEEVESQEVAETLNDQLATETKPTLADVHVNKKIDSIKKSLSINQRFMFINSLFDGDDTTFNEVLDYLDQCDNKDDALNYLQSHSANWDMESEEVEEFMELIDKKL